jgi:predicted  nucleic acid-binding Zn-ribbon protein
MLENPMAMTRFLFSSLGLTSALLCASLAVSGQKMLPVTHDSLPMSRGTQHAFSVLLPGAQVDDAEDVLKTAFKSYKGKASGNNKTELFFDDANIKALSENTVDVYVRLYQVASDVKADVFFDLGGIYLNPRTHPQQSEAAEKILQDYAQRYKRYQIEKELEEQNKVLDEREKAYDALVKEKEKMEKSIASDERNIEKARQEISINNMDQERKKSEIESQKDAIGRMGGTMGNEQEVAEKTLKGLEKELSKLRKDEEKLHKGIESMESGIAENRRNIERNVQDQDAKRREVEAQKSVVREVEGRLSAMPRFK